MIFLNELLKRQSNFMRLLKIESPKKGFDPETLLPAPELLSAAIGLCSEALEVVDAANVKSRPWKSTEVVKVEQNIAEEVIDCLFFVLEIFVLLGLNETAILESYNRKYMINQARIVGQYPKEKIKKSIASLDGTEPSLSTPNFLDSRQLTDDEILDICIQNLLSNGIIKSAFLNDFVAAPLETTKDIMSKRVSK